MNSPAEILPSNIHDAELSDARLPANDTATSWNAFLNLFIEKKARGTRLVRCRHQGPLYVQKPFFPEGQFLPHIYLLHPPGGVVSGDCLRINVDIAKDASTLLTTPGAGRVYRARKDKKSQGQHVCITVAEGGSAEWLPLENIVYPDANAELSTKIRLAEGSHFIGWDVTSLGLPAQQAAFSSGSLSQRIEVWVNDQPKIIEHLQFSGSDALKHARAGLQDFPINGTFIAGPFNQEALEEYDVPLIDKLRELSAKPRLRDMKSIEGISVVNGFIIGRYLGHCSESAKNLFTEYWALVRPGLLHRPACPPRIWST